MKTQGNKSRLSHLLGLVREEEMDNTEAVATIMLGVEAVGGGGQGDSRSVLPVFWGLLEESGKERSEAKEKNGIY